MNFASLSYRVPFSETDAMGVVHHSNHIRYLERGRIELLRLIDISYLDLSNDGYHIPVTGVECKYLKPLKFDDIVIIETNLEKLTKTRLSFNYRILSSESEITAKISSSSLEGTVLALGKSHHCCINEAGRPQALPNEIYEKLLNLQA